MQFLFEEELGARLLATYEEHAAGAEVDRGSGSGVGGSSSGSGRNAAGTSGGGGAAAAPAPATLDEAVAARYVRALPLPLMRRALAPLLAAPYASDAALLRAIRAPPPGRRLDPRG